MSDTDIFQRSDTGSRIRFECSYCGAKLSTSTRFEGKLVRCPNCSSAVLVAIDAKIVEPEPPKREARPRLRPERKVPEPRVRPGAVVGWILGGACAAAVLVVALALILTKPSEKERALYRQADLLAREITKDPLVPADFILFSGGRDASSIRASLEGNPDAVWGTTIREATVESVGIDGDRAWTTMRLVPLSGYPVFHWEYVDGAWYLRTMAMDEWTINLREKFEEEAARADRNRQAGKSEARLREAFESRRADLLTSLETRTPATLVRCADGPDRGEVVAHVRSFFNNLDHARFEPTPAEISRGQLFWTLTYTAEYDCGDHRQTVKGSLETVWRLEGARLSLTYFRSSARNPSSWERPSAQPSPDPEDPGRILRFAFDVRFIELEAEQIFRTLESEKVRFVIDNRVDLTRRMTVVMKSCTLREILEVVCPQLNCTYQLTSDGAIHIRSRG